MVATYEGRGELDGSSDGGCADDVLISLTYHCVECPTGDHTRIAICECVHLHETDDKTTDKTTLITSTKRLCTAPSSVASQRHSLIRVRGPHDHTIPR